MALISPIRRLYEEFPAVAPVPDSRHVGSRTEVGRRLAARARASRLADELRLELHRADAVDLAVNVVAGGDWMRSYPAMVGARCWRVGLSLNRT